MSPREMHDHIDYWGDTFQLDNSLRVRTTRGHGLLMSNPHVGRGRFSVWYPDMRNSSIEWLSDIEWMTDEAEIWINGFLVGNTPDLQEYLGVECINGFDETEDETERYKAFCSDFVKSGYCPPLDKRPTRPLVLSPDDRAILATQTWEPWAFPGERVWVIHDGLWVEADPQPKVVDRLLVGSICASRESHGVRISPASNWQLCTDCQYAVDLG